MFDIVTKDIQRNILKKNALIFDISLLKHSKSDVRNVTHFKGILLISLMLHNLKRNWKCKYIFSTGRHLKSLCHTPYIFGCLSKDRNISWTTCLISSQKISKDRQYITAINSVYCLTYIPFQKLIIKLLALFPSIEIFWQYFSFISQYFLIPEIITVLHSGHLSRYVTEYNR
jgi:hypothetical protein